MRPRGERGALELVYHPMSGTPLTLPRNTTMEQLRDLVEPGRYRLDPIAESGQQVEDAPPSYVEVIRPRQAADAGPSDDGWADTARLPAVADHNTEREAMRLTVRLAESVIRTASSSSVPSGVGSMLTTMVAPPAPAAPLGMFELFASVVHANTRMAEMVIQGAPSMMHAASHLVTAADGASLPLRRPVLLPSDPQAEAENEPSAPDAGLPPWVITLIQQAAQVLIPKVLDMLPGLPLAALFDWSKAVPPTPAPSVAPHPAVSTSASATPAAGPRAIAHPPVQGSSIGPANVPPSMASGAAARAPGSSSPLRNPAPPVTARSITSLPTGVVGVGAGANDAPHPAKPAESTHEPSPLGDSRELRTHLLALWSELSAPEREHAQTFLGALTAEERGQWMLELATLGVPDAVARVRDVIRPRAASPAAPQQGDPNENHP
jgi:hypothetical protein